MSRTKQQGFTLIEILVAVLVLSLGVLGLIAMESLALKSNQSAYHRSQATLLVYDLADRIRANREAALSYTTETPANHACNSSPGCTVNEIVAKDLYDWRQKLFDIFPGNTAVSWSVFSVSDEIYIAMRWDDDRNGVVDNTDPEFSTSFIP